MTREEFQSLHDSTTPDDRGCRRWPLSLSGGKYPQVTIDGKQQYGHRVSLSLNLGREIRPGYQALHSCDNSWCFSQEHLYEGTREDNTRDSMERLNLKVPTVRSCGPNHRLVNMSRDDILKVREIRDSSPEISTRAIAIQLSRPLKYVEDVYYNRRWLFVR